MCAWMDGRTDGRMDGSMDGCPNARMYVVRMYVCMDGWTDVCMYGWTDVCMYVYYMCVCM